MIDIHSHIAFDLDDGAQTIAESLAIAKQAVAEGIQTIIATPHQKHPSFEHNIIQLRSRIEMLQQAINEQQLPLEVMIGQEIRVYGEIVEDIKTDENMLTLNDSKYVLVEFPSSTIPKYTDKLFFDLLTNEYIPIIAHPERNAEIAENPEKLYRLIKNGALSQVTAASVAGAFGKKTKALSLQLIEHQLSHFIGSDVHNMTNRPLHWKTAHEVIKSKMGYEYVSLLQQNARRVIANQHVAKRAPEHIQKKKFLSIF